MAIRRKSLLVLVIAIILSVVFLASDKEFNLEKLFNKLPKGEINNFYDEIRQVRDIILDEFIKAVREKTNIQTGILHLDDLSEFGPEEKIRRILGELADRKIIKGIFGEENREFFDIVKEDNEGMPIFDSVGNPVLEDWVKLRGNVHNDGDWHMGAHILTIDEEGNIALQIRGKSADSPGKYDITISGHLRTGDKFLDGALREGKEEAGIQIDEDRLSPHGVYRKVGTAGEIPNRKPGYDDKEIYWYSTSKENREITAFYIYDNVTQGEKTSFNKHIEQQRQEAIAEGKKPDVDGIIWVSADELIRLLQHPRIVFADTFKQYFTNPKVLEKILAYTPYSGDENKKEQILKLLMEEE